MVTSMEVKDAFKRIANWVCTQTQERRYESKELDGLSEALITLRDYVEGHTNNEVK